VSGNSIALDTSVAIALLAGEATSLLAQPLTEILLPAPVIGELRYGALNSRRVADNLADVERLVSRCRVLDITASTAVTYARLRLTLKQTGKPIPENDLWIAALWWNIVSRWPRLTVISTPLRRWSGARYRLLRS
jgi:tRNA(fMet)-specific endonuclease VapC